MKWKAIGAVLAAALCLWAKPVVGEEAGSDIWCGSMGDVRVFPIGEYTAYTDLTIDELDALLENEANVRKMMYDIFLELFGDRCSRCEVYEGDPTPFGWRCAAAFTIETDEGEEAGVQPKAIKDPVTGKYSLVLSVTQANIVGWIYCAECP